MRTSQMILKEPATGIDKLGKIFIATVNFLM